MYILMIFLFFFFIILGLLRDPSMLIISEIQSHSFSVRIVYTIRHRMQYNNLFSVNFAIGMLST